MRESSKNLVLAPYVAVGFTQGTLNLGFGSLNVQITDKSIQKIILELAAFFKTPRNMEEVYNLPFERNAIEQGIELLNSKAFLVENDSWSQLPGQFQRMALALLSEGIDPINAYQTISTTRILILGCGAIGTSMALMLATLGVKYLTLVDDDIYDLTNTGRSPHISLDMIGQNKAVALKKLLKEKSPDIEVNVYTEKIDLKDTVMPEDCDFIVLSADSGYLLTLVNDFCIRNKISFMQVGYSLDYAVWGPLVVPGKTGCIACRRLSLKSTTLSDEERELVSKVNTGYIAPAPAFLVQFAVSLAIKDIVRFFTTGQAQSFNRQMAVSMDDLTKREMCYHKLDACICAN